MNEDVELLIDYTKDHMGKTLAHLDKELLKIRAGKASPAMLDGVTVDYYGTTSPISQVANINTTDARTLVVQPWDKAMLATIERAIINSNLGLAPMNNGEIIRLNIPPLTEERRLQLVKQVKNEGETARIGIRNARRDANDEIKKLKKDGLAEDMAKDTEDKIQKLTDEYIEKVEKMLKDKENQIMTV